ncbi:MAG: hypothetical protein ACJ72U_17350, partial [Nitrososphaeraceae archaeon]
SDRANKTSDEICYEPKYNKLQSDKSKGSDSSSNKHVDIVVISVTSSSSCLLVRYVISPYQ